MTQVHSPSQLIAALLDPKVYNHPVETCSLIETHISWVILTGNFAYKIKKPVDLGFLNFSTLEKRKFYCEEELRLNRRLAPDIYLEVVTITGPEDQPQLGGSEDTIEYAVKMRQFPQSAQLDRMLSNNMLQKSHIDALAKVIAEFHNNIAVAGDDSDFGTPGKIGKAIFDTIDIFKQHLHHESHLRLLNTITQWIETQSRKLQPILEQRKKEGFVRECHGDMHLRNLAWFENKAVIFDCIEFNDNLRWNDVISEIAFLVMDLDDRGESQLAHRFLNRYLEYTGDYKGLRLISFYLTYRALVRGMVAAIRVDQEDLNENEQESGNREIISYLNLAQCYTQTAEAYLIIARGLSGSGKTTITQELLPRIGAIRIRSDVERKRLFDIPAQQKAGTYIDQGIYTPSATQKTYNKLETLAESVIDAGFPVILDATFQKLEQRQSFELLASKLNVPFLILEFMASEPTLRKRIEKRSGDASDADIAVLEHQIENWRELSEDEKRKCVYIDTEEALDIDMLLQKIALYTNIRTRE